MLTTCGRFYLPLCSTFRRLQAPAGSTRASTRCPVGVRRAWEGAVVQQCRERQAGLEEDVTRGKAGLVKEQVRQGQMGLGDLLGRMGRFMVRACG